MSFFYLSTPSMRKVDDGESGKTGEGQEKECQPFCVGGIQNGLKIVNEVWKGSTLWFVCAQINFRKISFFLF